MSLRTYRRRVAELPAGLDEGSRFQAGVRAGELGLTPWVRPLTRGSGSDGA